MVFILGVKKLEEKMISRRNFLKSLGAVCGAAVVAPAALLKAKPEPKWKQYARCFNAHNGKEAIDAMRGERSKYIYIYGNHYIMTNKRTTSFIVRKNDETIQETK
jgi:hypothetical protein